MELTIRQFSMFLGHCVAACRTSLTYVLYDAYANIASHAYQILGTNTIILTSLVFYIAFVSFISDRETLLLRYIRLYSVSDE